MSFRTGKYCIFYVLVVLSALTGQHTVRAQGGRCRNPNNRNGQCLSIYNCPPLLGVLQSLNPSSRMFLQNSQCENGFGRMPYVCCTEDTGYTNTQQPTPTTRPVTPSVPSTPGDGKGLQLPSPPVCGKESLGNKIYSGDKTALSEFQWTALLGYRSVGNGQTVYECGGSLINQRYVLTAAHCVTGKINTDVGTLIQVRLGEYNTDTTTDCDDDNDCASNQQVDIPVEQVIPHDGFDDSSSHRHNDIALVRLSRNVEYGDFIKPVCMPWVVGGGVQRTSPVGTNYTVVGWGRTLDSRKSNIKLKLQLPLNDQRECAQKFSDRKVNIASTQICAGGIYARDSCDGDSGGPLMRKISNSWVLEGVVSFGNRCGLENWPGIYTRVSEYEQWIKRNLKA